MRTPALLTLALALPALAQNYAYSPAGTLNVDGNDNNTIPLWSDSSTYMQIHDHENMNGTLGGQATNLLGIALRQEGGPGQILGRTLTVQMTVAATAATTRTASNSFAANLGGGATVVLPYTQVSFPNLTSTASPNPPGILVPWATPYTFVPTPGVSFCWEWRHHSATSHDWATMDAVNMNNALNLANEGIGCTAGGQTQAATIDLSVLNLMAQTYQNRLVRGAANAPSAFVLGAQRTTLQLPGQCAPLLTNPLVFLPGGTDGVGDWDLTLPTPDLRGVGRAEIMGQFVWVDPSLPLSFGVSDMSIAITPFLGSYYMARFYAGPYQGGAGFETATNASGRDIGYGLVVGFMVP